MSDMGGRWIAAAIAVLLLVEPLSAQPENPFQRYAQSYADLSKLSGYEEACHVLSPTQKAGLEATRQSQKGALPALMLSPTLALGEQAWKAGRDQACTDTATQGLRQTADRETLTWIMRADAALRAEADQPWSRELTTLGPHSGLLTSMAGQIRTANPGAKALQTLVDAEAASALAAACETRRFDRSPSGPRKCPALSREDERLRGYGKEWLAQAETFTGKLATGA